LKSKGFTKNADVGYIFPGVDPKEVDAAIARRAKANN
jgi:hypothetical protein